jgi:hypothetical protein
MRDEVPVSYFQVLSNKTYGRTEENLDKPAKLADFWIEI